MRAAFVAAIVISLADGAARADESGDPRASRRSSAGAPGVAVIVSQDLTAYRRAIASFSAEHKGASRLYQLGEGENPARLFAALRQKPPAVVLAFGPLAIAATTRELPDVPALFLMVPSPERLGLTGRVSGVKLTVPPRAQMEVLRAGWPSATRILMVHDPRFSEGEVEAARRAGADLGVSVVPVGVQSPDTVAEALAGSGSADAVWMTADRTVASVAAFAALVAYARKKTVPLMALSEEQVRQGATVALVPSYTGMGRQAARLVARVLAGADPRGLPVENPEEMNISVAVAATRAGGGSMAGLAEMAAKRGWQLRPAP